MSLCPRTARLRAALAAELERRQTQLDGDPDLRRVELFVQFTPAGGIHSVRVRLESGGHRGGPPLERK